ncbi:acyl carrier protein [Streptomyces sp. NPDC101150]|uniref:acyl carrier protein n=1 Tax=Streptomyces sp. NPDC101150 TaxID=3366114 RepID=UPI00381D8ABD
MTVRNDLIIQDRYQLQDLLGAGGFGQVWKATDRTLEREVAVKFATSITDDPQAVARFTAEARKLARLHHRSIVTVHDAGTVADNGHAVPYLVMELLNGSTWQQSASVESVESAARIGASLAEALAYMHEMGIVHRDIKPANIMICVDGQAVLMDLGIARDFSTLTTVTATVSPGTLAYMAPEQLAGASASAASDVYALGLVLIEKITGRRGPAGQLSATDRATLTPRLHSLLGPMTALEPTDRPSMAECREQLGQSVLSRGPSLVEPSLPGSASKGPGRRARWAWLFSPQNLGHRAPAPQTAASGGELPSTSMSAAQEEILTGLAEITNEIIGIPIEDVQLDKSFKRLGLDSLSMIEVVVAAEERFDVSIPDDDLKRLKTVRDATDYILKVRRSR